MAADKDKGLEERRWVEVIDLHMTGHREDVERTVEFAHRFVKKSGDDAAVDVTGGPLVHAVEVTIDTEDASGVLFAHGARFGGHALYLKDRRLKYCYNFVGAQEQIVESDEPLPAGHVVLSASFEREGDSMPAEGTLTLYMGDREVGRGRIRTQPGKFSIAGEGLNIGKDSGEPVTDDYPGRGPWAFTGGTITRAAVDVSGAPFVDLAAEARMAFMRD